MLIKYGLARWLHGTEWEPARRLLTSHTGENLTDQPFPVRVRMAMTDLGTTFIKLGQVLGTRPDLVGPEVAHELSRLQSGTPADPPDVAVATVDDRVGVPKAQVAEILALRDASVTPAGYLAVFDYLLATMQAELSWSQGFAGSMRSGQPGGQQTDGAAI